MLLLARLACTLRIHAQTNNFLLHTLSTSQIKFIKLKSAMSSRFAVAAIVFLRGLNLINFIKKTNILFSGLLERSN